MIPKDFRHVVTCEHGGNVIPSEFADVFDRNDAQSWLESHRGYDPGSLNAAEQFAGALHTKSIISTTTRLLVDLNRSLDNDTLFSKFTRNLPEDRRQQILRRYYKPYHDSVQWTIRAIVDAGQTAIHLSIHTFTPRIAGKWRPFDVGLLYDPSAKPEANYCRLWRQRIGAAVSKIRVRMNEPYAGTDDGLTTMLRRKFDSKTYYGIEVEISNRFFAGPSKRATDIIRTLIQSLPSLSEQPEREPNANQ